MANWGSIKEGRRLRVSYAVAGFLVALVAFLTLGAFGAFVLALVW